MRNDFETNYLAHHGILGQKWGIRRYQNPDGSLTDAGRKRLGIVGTIKKNRAEKKKAKQRTKALEKARKARAAKAEEMRKQAELEANKQKTLQSGKASEILKYKGQLTNKELSDAVARLNWEKQLSEMSAKEMKTNWDKMDDLMGKVGKVTGYVNKGVDAYNAIDRALKIFDPDRGKSSNDGGGNKEKDSSPLEDIINSGNLKKIEKYSKQMSNKELATALAKVDNEKKLKNAVAEEKAEKKLKKEQKKAEKQAKRQKELDDFYEGPEWPEDDEDDEKRKRR